MGGVSSIRFVLSFAETFSLLGGWEVSHSSLCACSACRCCSFCGKPFSTAGSRKRHERDKHIENLSMACEQCGKWCKNRGALIKHRSVSHRYVNPNGLTSPQKPSLFGMQVDSNPSSLFVKEKDVRIHSFWTSPPYSLSSSSSYDERQACSRSFDSSVEWCNEVFCSI